MRLGLFRVRWQSPSNAHAYRLYVFNDLAVLSSTRYLLPLHPAAISGALDYDTVFGLLASDPKNLLNQKPYLHTYKAQTPKYLEVRGGLGGCKSLTMTYFHTGTRTIIGAKAFHCPVRDGKEWDHLAMVVRHNWVTGPSASAAWSNS